MSIESIQKSKIKSVVFYHKKLHNFNFELIGSSKLVEESKAAQINALWCDYTHVVRVEDDDGWQ